MATVRSLLCASLPSYIIVRTTWVHTKRERHFSQALSFRAKRLGLGDTFLVLSPVMGATTATGACMHGCKHTDYWHRQSQPSV